jgi:hypothetical protein
MHWLLDEPPSWDSNRLRPVRQRPDHCYRGHTIVTILWEPHTLAQYRFA